MSLKLDVSIVKYEKINILLMPFSFRKTHFISLKAFQISDNKVGNGLIYVCGQGTIP